LTNTPLHFPTHLRYASDERMNAELRAIERTDDPALAFLTKKRPKGPQLPKYKGPAPPPNRFGIQPGHRWDGVDRGNGFEKKLFEARGARVRREQDERAYGTSDM
jgi:pre-mRNA-splicing factor CWC26